MTSVSFVEPSCGGWNRTCVGAVNSRTSVPARKPPHQFSQDGWSRTSVLVLPGHAGYQASPRPETQSTQWESNPRFRHGKAAGYRYIMGAWLEAKLSKSSRAPGGTRTLVAALRKRCLRRWITGACSCADGPCRSRFEDAFKPLTGIGQSAEVGPEGLEPSPAWARTRDAAASTSIPSTSFQW